MANESSMAFLPPVYLIDDLATLRNIPGTQSPCLKIGPGRSSEEPDEVLTQSFYCVRIQSGRPPKSSDINLSQLSWKLIRECIAG